MRWHKTSYHWSLFVALHVMVASYTWGKDADRFDGLSNDEVPTLATLLFVTDATRRDATAK